jgi:hypothetical protein
VYNKKISARTGAFSVSVQNGYKGIPALLNVLQTKPKSNEFNVGLNTSTLSGITFLGHN